MNAAAIRDDSHKESTYKRFGFGYEEKCATSPSTQHAQAFFLMLLPQLRTDLTTTLFETSYEPLVKFLDAHQDDILSIKRNIEPHPFPIESAIRMFIHGWSSVKHQGTAAQFCDALSEWASGWNLTNEWCLNHAVVTLREQHLSCLGSGMPHARFTEGAWRTEFFEPDSEAIFTQAEIVQSFRHESLHEFTFKHEDVRFTVEGPFFRPVVQFKQEVRKEFEARGGRAFRGAEKSLQHQLRIYLDAVGTVTKERNLEEPPVRWAAEQHCFWLIEYQLAPCKTYRQVARDVKKDEKTVREGIQRFASLIGLTLRTSEADKRLGRPKGAKDKKPRHRVDQRREQLRGIAG